MLFAFVALVCLVSVPLLGGRLGLLSDIELRWIWPAVLGLLLQILIISVIPEGDTWVHTAAHIGSYVIVGAVVWANRHVPFLLMVGAGGLLNFIAITVNGGVMPASEWARRTAGMPAQGPEFTNSGVLEDPKLAFLGDVFPLPLPWSPNVFSVGDVVMSLGALLCLHVISQSWLGRKIRRPAPMAEPVEVVAPARTRETPLPVAVVKVAVLLLVARPRRAR